MKSLASLPIALFVYAVLVVTPAIATDAQSSPPTPEEAIPAGDQVSDEPDIWLISTRHLPCPRHLCSPPAEPIFYRRITCKWVRSSAEEFYSTANPDLITCMYVHGNRISKDEVTERGMRVYNRLGCPKDMRYIIWSWPSTEVRGRIRDARQKASRADGETFYVAHTLAGLPDSSTVSLIGYSFGARIVTGTLHLLGGGQLCGNSLPSDRIPDFQPRAVLLASAVARGWIRPGSVHGMATSKVDRMYSTFNPKDPALKRFYVTTKKTKPIALGYSGISQSSLGPNRHVVRQQNISKWVGWSHTFDRHLDSGPLMHQMRRYALWQPVP